MKQAKFSIREYHLHDHTFLFLLEHNLVFTQQRPFSYSLQHLKKKELKLKVQAEILWFLTLCLPQESLNFWKVRTDESRRLGTNTKR